MEELVKGGQGHSGEKITGNATVLVLCMMLCAATAVVAFMAGQQHAQSAPVINVPAPVITVEAPAVTVQVPEIKIPPAEVLPTYELNPDVPVHVDVHMPKMELKLPEQYILIPEIIMKCEPDTVSGSVKTQDKQRGKALPIPQDVKVKLESE